MATKNSKIRLNMARKGRHSLGVAAKVAEKTIPYNGSVLSFHHRPWYKRGTPIKGK